MLFITNRLPTQSNRTRLNRSISFNYQDTSVSQNLYFCERNDVNEYVEIGSQTMFARLKDCEPGTQVLFYVHGFNSNMEPDVFENAITLQARLNKPDSLVKVIPIIWPCDDDHFAAFIDDYWDDQDAADASGPAFARLLHKFDHWRHDPVQITNPCFRKMNILAHSMGNRILSRAFELYASKLPTASVPMLFRNIFMVAADLPNEALEHNQPGRFISDAARNVLVYYANDDWAMPASKLANIKHMIASRRLGMTGPESMDKVAKNVYEIDCDEFNNRFDLKGHHYFLTNKKGDDSPVIEQVRHAIKTGRVYPTERSQILLDE